LIVSSVSKCSSICVRGVGNGIERIDNKAFVDKRLNSARVIFFFCSLCKTYNLRTVVA
jgi:uncharacterized protein YlaI